MFEDSTPYDILTEKWNPVLNHDAVPAIEDVYKKKVTAVLLENQEAAMRQQYLTETSANAIGGGFALNTNANPNTNLAGYDPILISLVRRAMPNLMAYDIAGVQPMTAPTGLIFAMRSKYDGQGGNEALFAEPFAKFSGSGATSAGAATDTDPTAGVAPVSFSGLTVTKASIFGHEFQALNTARAEGLGESASNVFKEMAFAIDRIAVTAKTRALKAEYTTELAQDLKAVHGLDAETELANILSTEILAEMNRELIRNIYHVAKLGCQQSDLFYKSSSPGTGGAYDLALDSDGRWSAERFRGLMFQIEREANLIAKDTRRGKGNFIVCSSDVASALTMGGFLQLTPAPATQLEVDDTGNTFAGILAGKMRVYIDPYSSATQNFVCVGYRGASPYDAGLFYCPYVPLQMVRAVDPDTFQPKIGFKTRYGMVQNPFVRVSGSPDGANMSEGKNQYYRLFAVTNLHGNTGN